MLPHEFCLQKIWWKGETSRFKRRRGDRKGVASLQGVCVAGEVVPVHAQVDQGPWCKA